VTPTPHVHTTPRGISKICEGGTPLARESPPGPRIGSPLGWSGFDRSTASRTRTGPVQACYTGSKHDAGTYDRAPFSNVPYWLLGSMSVRTGA
jgi:hypothetical protein